MSFKIIFYLVVQNNFQTTKKNLCGVQDPWVKNQVSLVHPEIQKQGRNTQSLELKLQGNSSNFKSGNSENLPRIEDLRI
ncbi:unnamed protein product [Paramecium primaurelia]|uniref:Uncharacterized protein n=1 Tax=Paramecium primaurelia TaxID=5886 RepID=A0A8S1PEA6_PARPR|nr:unnamed protein product [Paramecium primaurelia]